MNATIQLPKLYQKQLEIKNDPAKTKIICAGRQVGKSTLLRDVAVNAMLKNKAVVYITPTFILADEMYDKILNVFPASIVKSSNKTNRRIKILTGGEVMFFSGEALSRARGFTAIDLLLVDEAAHIPDLEREFTSAMLPLLLKSNGDVWFVSTPNSRNYFYKLFNDGLLGINGSKSWQFSTYENPHISKEAIEALVSKLTEAQIREEIFGEPSESSSGAISSVAIRNATIKELSTEPAIVYGIDVAFQGNDRFVIVGLDANGIMCHFEAYHNQPYELLQKRIQDLNPDTLKVIDATGNGYIFYQSCASTCSNVRPFIWTASNKSPMSMELIRDIEQGKIKFNEETASEAYVYQFKKLPNGTTTYSAQSGFRDDCLAALCLANHFRNEAISGQDWSVEIF